MPVDDFAFDRQPDAVVGPLEHAHAQPILDGLHGLAHRGLDGMDRLSGLGETSLPGHFHQYLQRADIQHLFFPFMRLMRVFHFPRRFFYSIAQGKRLGYALKTRFFSGFWRHARPRPSFLRASRWGGPIPPDGIGTSGFFSVRLRDKSGEAPPGL